MKTFPKIVVLFLLAFIVSCQKPSKPPPAPVPPPVPTPSALPYPQVLGIPECDEYIAKFQSCIEKQIPDLAKLPLQMGFQKAIGEWKKTAAFPEKRSELGPACALAMDASKKATQRFQCQW